MKKKVEPESVVELKAVVTPIKKLTAFERERIAARQRMHEEEARRYLASR